MRFSTTGPCGTSITNRNVQGAAPSGLGGDPLGHLGSPHLHTGVSMVDPKAGSLGSIRHRKRITSS